MTKMTVDLDTASTLLNIKKDTLRKRIQRKNIEAIKDKAGKWQVIIDSDILSEQDTKQDKPDKGQDLSSNEKDKLTNALIEQLKSEVEYLRNENYRKDSIIVEMTKKIPLLEAPKENKTSWLKKLFKGGGAND